MLNIVNKRADTDTPHCHHHCHCHCNCHCHRHPHPHSHGALLIAPIVIFYLAMGREKNVIWRFTLKGGGAVL